MALTKEEERIVKELSETIAKDVAEEERITGRVAPPGGKRHTLTKDEEKLIEGISRKEGGRAAALKKAQLQGREAEFLAEEKAYEKAPKKKVPKRVPEPVATTQVAAPRIPQRMEPGAYQGLGAGVLPQSLGFPLYAGPGISPTLLAPYQARFAAAAETVRQKLSEMVARAGAFRQAYAPSPALAGSAATMVPWGGNAFPSFSFPATVAQNPIERLQQSQLLAQQQLQQQAAASQQARGVAGSQLANIRWNPQQMQQLGQQLPGTRSYPGQIFPEAPPLNLFPGGSYQGSVTSPWQPY